MSRRPLFEKPMQSRTITQPEEMWNAIGDVAKQKHSTTSEIIRGVLTRHLQSDYPEILADENSGDC